MTPFEELDEYLGEEMSLGYWAEEGIDRAAALIAALGPDDWTALKAAWRERPFNWLLHLAETLEYADVKEGIPLLLEMLLYEDDELAQQAADTLNMRKLQPVEVEAGPEVKARLEDLAKHRPGLDTETDRALLERIKFRE